MTTLRWMGVPEAEVRMVEGTHEETKGRVVCGPEEFRIDVRLRQECPKPIVHRSIGGDQQESEFLHSCTDILRKLTYR